MVYATYYTSIFYIITAVIVIQISGNLAILGKNDYDGYKIYKLTPQSNNQMETILSQIMPRDKTDLDILKSSRFEGDTTDVLISPEKAQQLEYLAFKHKVPIERSESNFKNVLENSERQTRRTGKASSDPFKYRSYEEMKSFIYNVSKSHKNCVQIDIIGKSYENRDLLLVKISSNRSENKPIILIDAMIHAREWVTGPMALYLIQKLASDCQSASNLSKVDWYIIPVVNPDGYEYSRRGRKNRMWRKTRSLLKGTECIGVDGNRNYGWHWGESGVSNDKCEDVYPGSEPFSEPETKAVASIMKKYDTNIKLYISLHSYGEYLLYPFGYTGDILPEDWKKLHSLAKKASDAIVKAGGKPFAISSAGLWYSAAGGSDDYAFGAMDIPYSYTMELTKEYGFTFPEEELRDYLEKVFNAFIVFADEISKKFPRSKSNISYANNY